MNSLNITNQDRLDRDPDGYCPLCGGHNYSVYLLVDDDPDIPSEHGMMCNTCGEHYPIEDEDSTDFL